MGCAELAEEGGDDLYYSDERSGTRSTWSFFFLSFFLSFILLFIIIIYFSD